ncbi:MAG: hypothetical protein R3B06_30225 [Kofleriaceae bacterium]
MPDYSKLHDLVSHRIAVEYDTGAKVVGMLASCAPESGQVEFVVLHHAQLFGSSGALVREVAELTISPNVTVGLSLDEGPRGRDVK